MSPSANHINTIRAKGLKKAYESDASIGILPSEETCGGGEWFMNKLTGMKLVKVLTQNKGRLRSIEEILSLSEEKSEAGGVGPRLKLKAVKLFPRSGKVHFEALSWEGVKTEASDAVLNVDAKSDNGRKQGEALSVSVKRAQFLRALSCKVSRPRSPAIRRGISPKKGGIGEEMSFLASKITKLRNNSQDDQWTLDMWLTHLKRRRSHRQKPQRQRQANVQNPINVEHSSLPPILSCSGVREDCVEDIEREDNTAVDISQERLPISCPISHNPEGNHLTSQGHLLKQESVSPIEVELVLPLLICSSSGAREGHAKEGEEKEDNISVDLSQERMPISLKPIGTHLLKREPLKCLEGPSTSTCNEENGNLTSPKCGMEQGEEGLEAGISVGSSTISRPKFGTKQGKGFESGLSACSTTISSSKHGIQQGERLPLGLSLDSNTTSSYTCGMEQGKDIEVGSTTVFSSKCGMEKVEGLESGLLTGATTISSSNCVIEKVEAFESGSLVDSTSILSSKCGMEKVEGLESGLLAGSTTISSSNCGIDKVEGLESGLLTGSTTISSSNCERELGEDNESGLLAGSTSTSSPEYGLKLREDIKSGYTAISSSECGMEQGEGLESGLLVGSAPISSSIILMSDLKTNNWYKKNDVHNSEMGDGSINLLAIESLDGQDEERVQHKPTVIPCKRKAISPLSRERLMQAIIDSSKSERSISYIRPKTSAASGGGGSLQCKEMSNKRYNQQNSFMWQAKVSSSSGVSRTSPDFFRDKGGEEATTMVPGSPCHNKEPFSAWPKLPSRSPLFTPESSLRQGSHAPRKLSLVLSKSPSPPPQYPNNAPPRLSLVLNKSPSPPSLLQPCDDKTTPSSSSTPFLPTRSVLKPALQNCPNACKCEGCASLRVRAERASEFSQRQMHDMEGLAVKLLNELKSMQNIVEDVLNQSSALPIEKMRVAVKSVTETEEMSKKWLIRMARDSNRFCKIMRMHQRKLKFADEAGGELCQIKVFHSRSISPLCNEKVLQNNDLKMVATSSQDCTSALGNIGGAL